jgi:hypothetical protein
MIDKRGTIKPERRNCIVAKRLCVEAAKAEILCGRAGFCVPFVSGENKMGYPTTNSQKGN